MTSVKGVSAHCIDLVSLGLLITMKSVFAVVELTVFLIQFMFAPN
ncbi:hypothetical protein PET01_21560 [Pediococcus ethanolidurans]|nr:hypothetical protein PET01_21560 [Pediococcus ethanolidurans]